MHDAATIEFSEADNGLFLKGCWRIGYLSLLEEAISSVRNKSILKINAELLTGMDTAGAYLLFNLLSMHKNCVGIESLQPHFQSLLDLIAAKQKSLLEKQPDTSKHSFVYNLGKKSVFHYEHFLVFVAFLGEVMADIWFSILNPIKVQWRSMTNEVDVSGYRALPIIAVMMLLIGVVVAYQLGVQLKTYAANVYVVDLSGIAILREFSPLIVSVIIAGRTSTSFAALIGTMKVNEEIDALRTMGLSPIDRLVLPRIFGLLIALPLLVVWGDVFGVFGSMIMAKSMMGIDFTPFLERFQQQVAIKHLYLGLVKTPIFALIIAGIGCYQGFQSEGSAESVGQRTTTAAVQSIFLIILADGIFSVLFNWLGL